MRALSPLGTFLDFNTRKSNSWVSELFREDIGEILTWKVFFSFQKKKKKKNLTYLVWIRTRQPL